jgi:hypothetical protein
MPIKRVFLLQTEMGNPDPWDDSLNLANVDVNPGLGLTNNAAEYQNNISFFQRADNRFSITNSVYTEYNLVLKRPFSIHDQSTEIPINFKQIADILESHLWRGHTFSANVIMMASLLEKDKPLNQQDVIANATYYYRHGEKIIDIISGDEIKNPTLIPWFFCYKTSDVPLYYMVLNPHSVQCIGNIEGNYNESQVYTISNHLKNLNEVVFKPKFSRNARVIGEHNIMVRGDTFTVEPFGSWFIKDHLPDFFKKAKLKIDTNFDYTFEDGKIKINTLNKQKGYLIIRWNTATGMDLIFHTSKNRFFRDYIVDVIN